MKILVIAAHPDDEILGVGGTILKHTANHDEIFVCIATKGYEPEWSKKYIENKIREQKKVDKILKVKKRFNLDFPSVKLNTISTGELSNAVTKVVEEVKPDIVYTHYENDLNYDHTLLFRASMVATRPPQKIKIYCYETLSETEWGKSAFTPNYWVEIGRHLEGKIRAFKIYKSEINPSPHPRSVEGIRILAKKRGSEICVKYAEAFIMIRNIWG